MATRYFALIIGIVYLLVAIMGFAGIGMTAPHADHPDLAVDAQHGRLLGLFSVNLLHNIVHLLVGLLGIASYRRFDSARMFSRGLAVFYGLLAVLGILPAPFNTMFGLVPIHGHDVWLHAVTAATAAYFGWAVPATADDRHAVTTTTTTGTGGPTY